VEEEEGGNIILLLLLLPLIDWDRLVNHHD